MARKAKDVEEEHKFLLVWHDRPGMWMVRSPHPDRFGDLEIPANQKVAVSDYKEWQKVSYFMRDVDANLLHVEWSDTVPQIVTHVISDEWGLNPSQVQVAQTICRTDPLTPQLIENIELHKLLGTSGMTRPGTRITKSWLARNHIPFLKATLELEKGWKNRADVVKMLNGAIEAIENL
jgi:hypothetical protein